MNHRSIHPGKFSGYYLLYLDPSPERCEKTIGNSMEQLCPYRDEAKYSEMILGHDSENDRFDLRRFLDAQAPVYARATAELAAGLKQSHWMWFVFPQAAGLGRSAMAVRYAIGSPEEAEAYWRHPILGERLRECMALVESWLARGSTAEEIFGTLDAMKYRSCRALFDPFRRGSRA